MANPTAYTQPHRIVEQSGLALRVDQIQDSAGAVVGGATQQATIADLSVTDGTLTVTDADPLAGILKVVTTEVDASGQGTAQTTAIATVPIHSVILSVFARVTEAFDGDTTTTFEVGTTANPDMFIDTSDFEPETLGLTLDNVGSSTADVNGVSTTGTSTLDIEALWTNTGSGSAGKVEVTVIYVEQADHSLGTELATAFAQVEVSNNTDVAASFAEIETKVNAILVALEDAGIVADA